MKKILAALLLAVLAVGALSITTFAEAKPFMNWKWDDTISSNSHFGNHWWNSMRPTSQNFVRVISEIDEWGLKEVNGSLNAQTRTITQDGITRQGTSVTAIWSANGTRPTNSMRNPQNSTYIFYTAKIVNASNSILNFENHDLYINGSWTVYNITSTITVKTDVEDNVISVDRNQSTKALATKAYGELTIDDCWKTFALKITGIDDQVTGLISYQKITSRSFNLFKIFEDENTNTVTPADVLSVAKSFGSSPGWGAYNHCMDYNFNYKIDITDLATAAANIGRD